MLYGGSGGRSKSAVKKYASKYGTKSTSRSRSSWTPAQQSRENQRFANRAVASRAPRPAAPVYRPPSGGSGRAPSYGGSGRAPSYGGGGGAGYRPPAPPSPRKLNYQQLLAMVKSDPNLVAELASYGRFRKLAASQAAANKGLIDTDFEGELSALTRSTEETRRLAEEEAAAAGRLRSNPYSRRLGNINEGFEENRGRLRRQRNAGRLSIEQALQTALENYTLNENSARQNAINRLLSSRSDIARGY